MSIICWSSDGCASDLSAFFNTMRKRPCDVIGRFWDQSDLRCLNGGRAVNDYSKPADFLVTQNAQIEYAEVKSVQSATSFPFSNIERGQRSAALRQAMVGGDRKSTRLNSSH